MRAHSLLGLFSGAAALGALLMAVSPAAALPAAALPAGASPSAAAAPVVARGASLTEAEVAFLRQLVATAPSSGGPRLRGLVQRGDLAPGAGADALVEAVAAVPFTDARGALLRSAMSSAPSVSARSSFAPSVARAILARADAVLAAHPDGLEGRPDALAELTRLYAFVEADLAAPKRLRALAGDAAALNEGAFEACAVELARHLRAHPQLALGTPAGAELSRLRARAAVALVELAGEGSHGRAQAANLLGLAGARRDMLTDLGVLALDDGHAAEARLIALRGVLERLPGARAGVEAMAFGEARAPFPARIGLVALQSPLAGGGPSRGVLAWHEDVDPGVIDDSLADLTVELAERAVVRAFEQRPDLKLQAERDVASAAADPGRLLGRPLDPGAPAALAAAVGLLAVDAPRVLDLAAIRFASHRPETAALVSDAIGALAATAPSRGAENRVVAVGRPRADGTTESLPLRVLRTDAAGAAQAFELSGVRWEIERTAQGAVRALRRDGAPVRFSVASSGHIPLSDAFAWKAEGLVFARVLGAPYAGAGGSRFRLVGTGAAALDAVATPAPGADVEVQAVVSVANDEGGLALRASADDAALRGVSVVITPGAPAKASLVLREGGAARSLTTPVTLPRGDQLPLHVVVRGQTVQASVGGQTLQGFLPPALEGNAVALYAKRGAVVEVGSFRVARAR